MSFVFDYDKKTKQVNRMIRKFFGADCNCFFCFDTFADEYRLSFVETTSDRKHEPTQLINNSLNHLFFNNLNGLRINAIATNKEILSLCAAHLNYYKDRRNFLLNLCNLFCTKFNMTETGAISDANIWQSCILSMLQTKNKVTLLLSPRDLENISKKNVLYKMAKGLDMHKNSNGVEYKILELDMDTLETTILMYS